MSHSSSSFTTPAPPAASCKRKRSDDDVPLALGSLPQLGTPLQRKTPEKAASTKNNQNKKTKEGVIGDKRGAQRHASSASSNGDPSTSSSCNTDAGEQLALELQKKIMDHIHTSQKALADENQTLRAKLAEMQTQMDQKDATIEKLHASMKDVKGLLKQNIKVHHKSMEDRYKNKANQLAFRPSNVSIHTAVDALFLNFDDGVDQNEIFSTLASHIRLYFGGWEEVRFKERNPPGSEGTAMNVIKQRLSTLTKESDNNDTDCGVGEVNHLISLHGRILCHLRERYQLVVEDAYLKLNGKCNSLESEQNIMQNRISKLEDRNQSIEREKNTMQTHISNLESDIVASQFLEDEYQSLKNEKNAMQGRISGLEDRHQFLAAKCGSFRRTLESIMSIDDDELESATEIPDEYWIEQGFDEPYIRRMKSFLESLEHITQRLASGKSHGEICLGPFVSDGAVMLHDDELSNHWRELADALQLYGLQKSLELFSVANVQLTPAVLDMLGHSLRETTVRGFQLNNNGFANTTDGVNFAIKFLRHNMSLRTFSWKENPITVRRDVTRLCGALDRLPSLQDLHMIKCCGDTINGYGILRLLISGACQHLKKLSFVSNNISTGIESHVPEFLATNPQLMRLNLEDNRFNDRDATLIANALRQNTNLRDLNLARNEITDGGCSAFADLLCRNSRLRVLSLCGNAITVDGWDSMKNAVFNSSDLNSLACSNHTCQVLGMPGENLPYSHPESSRNFNNKLSLSKSGNWKWKMYSILSNRNEKGSNAFHLDIELGYDYLKLVPKVLEIPALFQRSRTMEGAGAVPPLSIMFELLRNWKMPLLFDLQQPPLKGETQHGTNLSLAGSVGSPCIRCLRGSIEDMRNHGQNFCKTCRGQLNSRALFGFED